MAKTIKSIKCPSCGSAKVAETRLDYYKCTSCGTDFFLDSNDININHNYKFPSFPDKKKLRLIAGLCIAFLLILLLVNICSSPKKNSSYPAIQPIEKKDPEVVKTPIYNWDKQTGTLFVDAKGTPYYVIVGYVFDKNEYINREENKIVYIGLFNPKTNKEVWVKKLINEAIDLNNQNLKVQTLEDGHVYIIVKNKEVYQLNKNDLTVKNITEDYVKNNELLRIGIAKIEFKYADYGSGYTITNNEGKLLAFYPLINKAFLEKDLYNHRTAPLPQPTTKTGYKFSRKSHDFPDEKLQLIKYDYHYQYGYPIEEPRFSWDKDYGRSGIFYGGEPYVKRLINNWNRKKMRLINFKDLTPDRLYFDPMVLAYNEEYLIIAFNPTPAEDDTKQIHFLNPATGAILKTINTDMKYFRDNNVILQDGIIVESSNDYYYYDNAGKLVNIFKAYNPEFTILN